MSENCKACIILQETYNKQAANTRSKLKIPDIGMVEKYMLVDRYKDDKIGYLENFIKLNCKGDPYGKIIE
jgi:hypothetical protein